MRMTWTTKRKKTEERASEDGAMTHKVEIRERRRLGGRGWKRKCSGRGYRGSDSMVHNNGVDNLSSPGVIHRTLHTLTTPIDCGFLPSKASTCNMDESGKRGTAGVR